MKLIFLIFSLCLVGCSTNGSRKNSREESQKRGVSALVELEINEISDNEFERRKSIFRGNMDDEIDELENYDEIISESVGVMKLSDLVDLGHVSEPITQAVIFCHQKNIKSGLKILNAIFSTHGHHPRFWNAKGICHLQNYDLKKAKYFFDLAIADKPYAPAINNLAVLFYRSGDHQKAYLLLENGIKNSRLNTLRYNFSLLNFNKGLYRVAVKYLEEISGKNKKLDMVTTLLAASYLRMNDLKKYADAYQLIQNKNTFFSKINYALYVGITQGRESGREILTTLNAKNSVERQLITSYRQYISEVGK